MSAETKLRLTLVEDFDDPRLDGGTWDRLLASGSTNAVFLTFAWQREWWRAFSADRLLVVLAGGEKAPTAIAPLFAMDDMLFLVGSGGSDYLDFIGSMDEATLAAMLDTARRELPEFEGITLFHVPLASKTTTLLEGVAERLDLELVREGGMAAPYLDLTAAERVQAATARRKLRKEEARMRNAGPLVVRTAQQEDLDPWLEVFLSQHTARWTAAGEEGIERDDARAFYRAVVHAGHRAGWLRFTMLEWRGRSAAFDITLAHGGRHLSYLVSRDASIRGYSPGRILERHVIARAAEEGARCFDYGLGDEEYKLHYASGVAEVANWSLYP